MIRYVLTVVGVLAIAGCSRSGPSEGRAGLPPSGHVRIIPTKNQEDAKSFSWLWTIYGERNWTTPTVSGDEIKLTGSYPFNSKDRSNGTNIWTGGSVQKQTQSILEKKCSFLPSA